MKALWKKQRGRIVGGGLVAAVLALLALPAVLWRLTPDHPMDITIVDKTVPRPEFRKHAALFWALRHDKVVRRDTGAPFNVAQDYSGYHPAQRGRGTVVPIPDRPSDLTYVSDTYGVYEDDLTAVPRGVQSPMIYGGLSVEEVGLLLRTIRPGGTLVGEFNSIATPTIGAARDELSGALGVRWTGWTGRHFAFLEISPDLPQWIPNTWRRQTGSRWDFRGPGYVLVSERGTMVVLLEGVDTPMEPLTLNVDAAHADEFGTLRRLRYDGWFEVMEPLPSTEVVATYDLQLTQSGRAKMRGVPIAGRWPAVVRTRSKARTTYYFAGDFSDRAIVDSAYRYTWLPRLKRLTAPGDRDNMERFFWGVYVPIMQTILRQTRAAVDR